MCIRDSSGSMRAATDMSKASGRRWTFHAGTARYSAHAPGSVSYTHLRENSMRNPRRTAQTASALMIGIALVSAMAVFGASVSRSATSSIDDAISADLIISGTSNGSGSFSRALADAVTRVPGVTSSLIAYGGEFEEMCIRDRS